MEKELDLYHSELDDTTFVPLVEGIPEDFQDLYEINKLGHIKTVKTGTLCSDGFYCTRGPREEK